MSNAVLYQRDFSYIPRIAGIHDMCGYGKCSLGVAIPTLSAAGCDVCPVPTALFSSHTLYPRFTMHDTTEILSEYIDAWETIKVDLDAVYSGFLGNAEQVTIIKELCNRYPKALRVIDPVMGDGGKIYPTYTPELCEEMKSLVDGADLLVPNLTEASIITDLEYTGQVVSDDEVKRIMDALFTRGAKNIVLKGVQREGKMLNFVQSSNGELSHTEHTALPYLLHGTGDLYASALLGAVMAGKGLRDSAQFAGALVYDAMIVTKNQPDYEMRGVSFELVLGKMAELLK